MQAIADTAASRPLAVAPTIRASSRGVRVEGMLLVAALALSLLFAARMMAPAFQYGGVVQDDQREHVYWMARFRDPELFRNDLISDYFQALDPPGYKTLYWLLSLVMDPLQAAKLLPPVLGLLVALFTYLLARRLYPSPSAAFLSSALLSWFVWQVDDIASATPRAFLVPFLAAEVWALAAGRLAVGVGLIALAALFYPAAAVVGAALLGLRLLRRRGWRLTLSRERSAWLALIAAIVLVVAAQIPTQIASARFGRVVSTAEAMAMPEFGPDGRSAYFGTSPYRYWLESQRSGLDLRVADGQAATLPILIGCLLLAGLLPAIARFRALEPNAARLGHRAAILLQLLVASFALYVLAHLVLFQLHYPNRFIRASLPLAVAVGAGLSLASLLELIGNRLDSKLPPSRWSGATGRTLLVAGLALGLGALLVIAPARSQANFRRDRYPAITEYLRGLPKDTLVAGAPGDVDGISSFAQRRVLASHESALAFHQGYYGQLRQRLEDLMRAYYAESPAEVADFASRYGVDVFLVSRAAFEQSTYAFSWAGQSNTRFEPYTSEVSQVLQQSEHFALLSLMRRCAVLEERGLVVMPARCIQREARQSHYGPPAKSP